MLAEWSGTITGTLHLLPLWHPLLLAEQVATLACLAPGRFVLQCAIGPDDEQFPAFGVSARERRPRFERHLDVLRRLWAGEVVHHEGPPPLRGARVSPLPPEPIEVWVGAVAPAAIDRAARLGDGWIAAPALTPETARRQLAHYRESCEAHGRARGAAVIRRDVYVGESADEAWSSAGPLVEAGHRGFSKQALVVGDVETVTAAFRDLADAGYEHVLARNLVDQKRAIGCIERLGAVRAALGGD
jgi:alkanesulfonate monooxygenase SsuD/methylene tetrahydromethanopterin reductase-like flavin-dependent oxidoreductase (luciferase family)